MPDVTFCVDKVVGKARPRVLRSGRAYTPKPTRDAEKAIASAYRAASRDKYGEVVRAPSHVPVMLRVVTRRPLPESRPRAMRDEPDTYRPDWDNIGKITDALNGVAWADDAQVTCATVVKRPRERGAVERTRITVIWGDDALLGG